MAAPPDAMAAWLAHTQSRVQAQKLVAAGRPAARAAEPTGGACTATTPTVIGWVHQGALAVPSAAVPAATSAWRTLGTSTVPPLAQLRALHADGVELAPAWMQALRAGGPVERTVKVSGPPAAGPVRTAFQRVQRWAPAHGSAA